MTLRLCVWFKCLLWSLGGFLFTQRQKKSLNRGILHRNEKAEWGLAALNGSADQLIPGTCRLPSLLMSEMGEKEENKNTLSVLLFISVNIRHHHQIVDWGSFREPRCLAPVWFHMFAAHPHSSSSSSSSYSENSISWFRRATLTNTKTGIFNLVSGSASVYI